MVEYQIILLSTIVIIEDVNQYIYFIIACMQYFWFSHLNVLVVFSFTVGHVFKVLSKWNELRKLMMTLNYIFSFPKDKVYEILLYRIIPVNRYGYIEWGKNIFDKRTGEFFRKDIKWLKKTLL